MDQRRGGRVNHTIQRELGSLIEELSDPRLSPMTSVTSVDVNRDLSMAKVHVSVLGTEQEREDTLEALRSAATRLRMELSQRIVIRKMPRLSFYSDDTMQTGADMDQLIDRVMSEDSRRFADRDGS
ncbi:30S ribosome-binding factor RbfA [Candidatus Lucifugimonas marina]|uniref:Ribosome-binding factor A n=1 Tax=Candidatus Lucifugimonas marina TaxID=3038979 RepID=A0AAJ6CV21_9CHLR|nr:30S ribosome-binding factor RbfA [SAR202 cluster bacterium JH702]MDG0870557.1 30S ribosome-binding factor RbfA [SAR202 cluster bacterium JH639]WFG35901.1 30S ribosome-binding factor RbfA [SAR202 cluster bacterium JH545]WFG39844.1 30S ribosome-binding factor RbfA [SAR202 cluster bacterium JH1073]